MKKKEVSAQLVLSPTSTGDKRSRCTSSKPILQFGGRAQVAVRELVASPSTRLKPTSCGQYGESVICSPWLPRPVLPLRVRTRGNHNKVVNCGLILEPEHDDPGPLEHTLR